MGENEGHKATHGWLDPLNRGIIQAAVRAKYSVVRLRDGRIFKLTYHNDRGHETVKLMPKDGFIPQGEFDVKRVTGDLWVESDGIW